MTISMNLIDKIRDEWQHRSHGLINWKFKKLIRDNLRFPYGVVMDIGSGEKPQQFIQTPIMWCVDPTYDTNDTERIRFEILTTGIHRVRGTWDAAIEIMKDEHIDTVFLMDIIEHLPKAESKEHLWWTERLVKRQIVVFTPFGYLPQEDGEWNTHRSGWSPEDFGKGWRVFILKGFHSVDFKNRRLHPAFDALLAIYKVGDGDENQEE